MNKKDRKRKRKRRYQQEFRLPKDKPEVAHVVESTGTWIQAKSKNQADYIETIRKNDVIIAIGPAGTGKTFLSVAMAVQALKDGEIHKIIITRPIVEAGGEKLGYLPGDLEEKINPYLRPIYDAFEAMLGPGHVDDYIRNKTIEIAPLAYMRGRTLENAYIILDEAQNANETQVEMLLTRMGEGSKIIITGDITQVDLPKRTESGLASINEIIGHLDGVEFQYFTDEDVVRHPLVKKMVKCYEIWKEKKKQNGQKK